MEDRQNDCRTKQDLLNFYFEKYDISISRTKYRDKLSYMDDVEDKIRFVTECFLLYRDNKL